MEKNIKQLVEEIVPNLEVSIKKELIEKILKEIELNTKICTCTCNSINYGYGFALCYDCKKIKNV